VAVFTHGCPALVPEENLFSTSDAITVAEGNIVMVLTAGLFFYCFVVGS